MKRQRFLVTSMTRRFYQAVQAPHDPGIPDALPRDANERCLAIQTGRAIIHHDAAVRAAATRRWISGGGSEAGSFVD
jgi:hypothetical protein